MDDVEITVCPPNAIRTALEILFASLPPAERSAMVESLRHEFEEHATAREGLLTAIGKDGVCGTVLVQRQAGETAILWPPGTRPADRKLAHALAEAADFRLAHSGASMAQALFSAPDESAGIAALESVGFERLTELEYLAAAAERVAEEASLLQLVFEPYHVSNRSRLAALIEQTYAQTRDCPQLNGVRDVDDVITGYEATGTFDPARWFFIRRDERDVGVLLLSEHEPARQWELVYMGVVPHARQQGVGKAIVKFALGQAFEAGAESLLLAVDASNRPAAELYHRCGFRTWNRRIVYWKRYQ